MVIGVAISVAALLVLSACGNDTGTPEANADDTSAPSSPTDSSSTPVDGSSCESVWVEGSDLPQDYDGCVTDGTMVEPQILECSSGQRIVLYDDHYWALRGQRIGYAVDGLENDEKYKRVLYSCRA